MNLPFSGKRSIVETPDFKRILALPRRTPYDVERIATELTEILKVPGGTMSLRPVQAQALYEIGRYGGLFGPIRVGGGKTLISLLAPFVLGAKRPVLLLPASLREKTEDNRQQLAKHFRVARDLRLISYEEMGLEKNSNTLHFYRPDLLIADEAHRLKNKRAGVTRRVIRYMREFPSTRFVAISGTMIKGGTIKAFAHILRWTHKDGAPIPLHDGELDEWADALDENSNMFTRTRAGALLKLASDEDVVPGDELRTARRAFHRRLVETPAVVSTAGEQVSCSLYIRPLEYTPSAVTDQNFIKLRGDGTRENPGMERPDGWALTMATERWRVGRELALGFHSIWDPSPPQDWINARKAWAAFVREVLSRSQTLDTELQVAKACADGKLPDAEWRAWMAVKDTFRINTKDVWHDDAALKACAKWMKDGPGIVWVEHVFFGDALERLTGFPYFREQGLDKAGRNLEAVSNQIKNRQAKAGPIIASVQACSTGFNLQPWCRNLVTSCPSGAGTWEQLLGRTHRDGQTSDQVEVDVLMACIEHAESWEKACAEARMAVDTIGDSQKILIADSTIESVDVLGSRPGPRWRKRLTAKND